MTTNQLALTKDEVRLYHQQGWLGPFALISEEEMAAVRRRTAGDRDQGRGASNP